MSMTLRSEKMAVENMTESITAVKDKHVLSLFSGAGGMDLGFEGGFQVLTDFRKKSPILKECEGR